MGIAFISPVASEALLLSSKKAPSRLSGGSSGAPGAFLKSHEAVYKYFKIRVFLFVFIKKDIAPLKDWTHVFYTVKLVALHSLVATYGQEVAALFAFFIKVVEEHALK